LMERKGRGRHGDPIGSRFKRSGASRQARHSEGRPRSADQLQRGADIRVRKLGAVVLEDVDLEQIRDCVIECDCSAFNEIVAVYVLAFVAGTISHVPGGLGVFDAVILVGLGARRPADEILAGLLAFRIIYQLIPVVAAGVLFAALEATTARRLFSRIAGDIGIWVDEVRPTVLAACAFTGGIVLLFSNAMPLWRRLLYRGYRHPLVLFGLGPVYFFVICNRIPTGNPLLHRKSWSSILGTNAALAAVVLLMVLTVGTRAFMFAYLPVVLLAASIGIWLFYMQHQLEHAYWASAPNWEFHEAALKGSSFYDLPVVLHWLTGYIGFHHIHHICTNIPELSLAGLLQPQPRVPRCQAPHLS